MKRLLISSLFLGLVVNGAFAQSTFEKLTEGRQSAGSVSYNEIADHVLHCTPYGYKPDHGFIEYLNGDYMPVERIKITPQKDNGTRDLIDERTGERVGNCTAISRDYEGVSNGLFCSFDKDTGIKGKFVVNYDFIYDGAIQGAAVLRSLNKRASLYYCEAFVE